ncbi:MAG: hypothetical protein GY789_09395 [Hyphomicrobiales bacterium]|nr:hypothetical protein [Hyphomicrobiales bacterium]MCP4998629.1 hypothetical protein [Hyphomicrobiales bacterium]
MSDALIGTDGLSITSLLIIGAVVVIVMGLILWHLRRRGHMAFIRGGSNRQPRLAVLDAAAVDARRRLVLVRRDNVEHLIMIGGPSDIVVERGINRVAAAARPSPETAAAQASTPPQAEAAQPSAPKGQQQPAQPRAPQRPEPSQPPHAETKPSSPAPSEVRPSPPAQMDTGPAPPSANARSAPPRPDKPPAPAPALAAVAVSAAAASAANQMAKLDDPGQDTEKESPVAEAESPVAETKSPVADAKSPVVEIQAPAVATATIPDEENVITAELEDVLGAARELVMPEETKTEPKAAEEIIAAPRVDVEPSTSDMPAIDAADTRETVDTDQPHAMTAEELIADFDELLEAEISKAEKQKAGSEPEHPIPPTADSDVKPPARASSASLEDEMKKLLGDLNVKQ